MNTVSFTRVTHKQAEAIITTALKANVVPFFTGAPAVGKSSLIASIAKKANLELIDVRLTQLQPYDLSGLIAPLKDEEGQNETATYLPVDIFPYEHTELPAGKDGFLLFLDEFNSADRYTLAAAYKLILDRAVGKHKLHPNTRIVTAGNRVTDGAIASALPSALQSRVIHLELDMDNKEWVENYLNYQTDWNSIVKSYLNYRPSSVCNFPDDPKTKITFASPRTWEFLSKMLNNSPKDVSKEILQVIVAGAVGQDVLNDFMAFYDTYADLPTIQEIMANPHTARLPDSPSAQWAMGLFLADHVTKENAPTLINYMERVDAADIRIMGYRAMKLTCPEIAMVQELKDALVKTARMLA